MEVTIREAEAGDVPGLEILRRQAIEAAFRPEYDRERYVDLVAGEGQRLDAWVERDDHEVLLAETEVTPVCYAALDLEETRLVALFTSPDYQEEGFARLVVERLQSSLAPGEALSVVAPEPAVGFFERLGFEAVDDDEWNGMPAKRLRASL